MDKQELVERIRAGRKELEATLERTSEQMDQPALDGGWSVKDLIAHLSFWEQRAATVLETLQAGETPTRLGDMDEVNAKILAENRNRPLDDIRIEEAAAYHKLVRLVEASPDADLFDGQRFAWMQGGAIFELIEGDTYGHYQEHLPALRAWLENQVASG